jgi:hypothetical protein
MQSPFTRPSRLMSALAIFAFVAVGAVQHAKAADLATELNSNPQFSDFATELKISGMWSEYSDMHGVTLFVPTNAAFDKTGTAWQATMVSQQNFDGNGAGFAFQDRLRGTVIKGQHGPDAFLGKAQFVRSISGPQYWVDGRDGGTIKVMSQVPANVTVIGGGSITPKTAHLGQPIVAGDVVIYPMDTIVQ